MNPQVGAKIYCVGCKPEEVKIGMKVQVVFEDVTEEITLPKFKPIGDKNQG